MIRFDCRLARPGFAFDVAFEAREGITALFGPSGSGKTTAIRMIAGIDRPDSGTIMIGDDLLDDTAKGIRLAPHRRRIGLVHQDALLLPHLRVRANLAYGRWFTRASERRIATTPVVEVLGIGHLLDRWPETLSGGERQRVAIGRALLTSPRLLLMDEPLASLDRERKQEILPFIERMRDEFAIPVVYVSHDIGEVARLAGTVVRLAGGKVEAIGTASAVLGQTPAQGPDHRFETASVLTATVLRDRPDYGVTELTHPAGQIVLPGRLVRALGPAATVRIVVRSTQVTLAKEVPGKLSVRTVLKGRIIALATDTGPFALATISLPGGDLLRAYLTRLASDDLGLAIGDEVHALVKSVDLDESGTAGA